MNSAIGWAGLGLILTLVAWYLGLTLMACGLSFIAGFMFCWGVYSGE